MTTALHALYPPECLLCRDALVGDAGLCAACWRDVPFIVGDVCSYCGVPLQGDVEEGDACDACMQTARPWTSGRSALIYKDRGRQLVMALKHGDRHDIVGPAARWMAQAARDLQQPGMLVVPVPLHWMRQARRRFNQSALLANALGRELDLPVRDDCLTRVRATRILDGKGREARFEEVQHAIRVPPRKGVHVAARPILLVDDVMTSGATLAACTDALLASRASEVHVMTLARVAKDA